MKYAFIIVLCVVTVAVIWNHGGVDVEGIQIEILPEDTTVKSDGTGNPQPVIFALVNHRQHPVRILSVDSSCGCTVVDLDFSEVEAYGKKEFTAMVTPPEHGSKYSRITIQTDDPDYPKLRAQLLLEGEQHKTPVVLYHPNTITFEVSDGQKLPLSFNTVIRTLESSGKDPWVKDVKCNSPEIDIDIVDMSESEGRDAETVTREYHVQLMAGSSVFEIVNSKLPNRRLSATIIATKSIVHVAPIMIDLKYIPVIQFIPDSLFYQASENTGYPVRKSVVVIMRSPVADSTREVELSVLPHDTWLAASIDRLIPEENSDRNPSLYRMTVQLCENPSSINEDASGKFLRSSVQVVIGHSTYSIPVTVLSE